jgi:hypothetical protein
MTSYRLLRGSNLVKGEIESMIKLFIRMTILLSLVIVVIWGGVWYVKPEQMLDLKYEEVPVSGLILDMVKSRKLEVRLTAQDVNNIVKKHLAAKPALPHDFVLTGADVKQQGVHLEADVNLIWDYKVHVGAKLTFKLAWDPPNLQIVHIATQMKDLKVPLEWFHLDPISVPLQDNLPKLVGIKGVFFDDSQIRIALKLN